MPIQSGTGSTNQTMTVSAFKKLVGKSNTGNQKAFYEETVASSIQINTKRIFGDDIPQNVPNPTDAITAGDLYNTYSASAGNPEIVQIVEFDVVGFNSQYDADADKTFGDVEYFGGDESQVSGEHGYYLRLSADYNTSSSFGGTAPFSSSQVVYSSNGALQLVHPQFGPASSNGYFLELYTSKGGTRINDTDPIDWIVDYYNGTILVQDYDATKIPTYAVAYIYIGKYADQKIIDASGSGGGGGISDVVSDTSPQLGGNLDVNGRSIVSVTNGDIILAPHGTGSVIMDGDGSAANGGVSITNGSIDLKNGGSVSEIKMYCEATNAHYVRIASPAHGDFSGNPDFVLPPTEGTNGQVLKTDGSGNTSWGEAGISFSRRALTANATASANDSIIGISSSGNSDNIELRLASADALSNGQYFTVKKEDNYSSTITISCSGSQKIDGQSSVVIESPFGAVNIYSDSTSSYFIY